MSTVSLPLTASVTLHQCATVLALSQQQVLPCDAHGQLSASTLATVVETLGLSEAQQPLGEAWVALTHAAGLLAIEGKHLQPTPAVKQWLALPPTWQLLRLRQAWWFNPATGWAGLKRQWPQATMARWEALLWRLCLWSVRQPPQWWPLAHARAYLADSGLLRPAGPAARLPRAAASVSAQHWALAKFTLRGWFPALGLAHARHTKGAWQIRLSAEGQNWLREALARKALWEAPEGPFAVEQSVPDIAAGVAQHPDFPALSVTLAPEDTAIDCHFTATAPAALSYHLRLSATPYAIPPLALAGAEPWVAHYRLTQTTVARAAEWGYRPEQIIFLLGQFSGGELSPAALARLRQWQATINTLKAEPGYYLRLQPETLHALHQCRPFRQRVCLVGGQQWTRRFTPQGVWVAQDQATALFRYLRRLGYQVNVPDAPAGTSVAPQPSPAPLVPPAALTALLVICHMYQDLRQRWPALAQAEVESLIRDLERALPDADRAAVARLVAAQRAILARKLEQAQGDAPPPSHILIERAIATGTPLTLAYIDTHARRSQRVVHPLRLEERGGQTYLVARCELRGEERSFRLDRIVGVEEEK